MVKNLPATQETWVGSLGWEDPLEKGKATHSQYSGLENSMECIVCGVTKSSTGLSDLHVLSLYTFMRHCHLLGKVSPGEAEEPAGVRGFMLTRSSVGAGDLRSLLALTSRA